MHVYELHFATALINMWTVTFGEEWGALLQFRSGKLLQASQFRFFIPSKVDQH